MCVAVKNLGNIFINSKPDQVLFGAIFTWHRSGGMTNSRGGEGVEVCDRAVCGRVALNWTSY